MLEQYLSIDLMFSLIFRRGGSISAPWVRPWISQEPYLPQLRVPSSWDPALSFSPFLLPTSWWAALKETLVLTQPPSPSVEALEPPGGWWVRRMV